MMMSDWLSPNPSHIAGTLPTSRKMKYTKEYTISVHHYIANNSKE